MLTNIWESFESSYCTQPATTKFVGHLGSAETQHAIRTSPLPESTVHIRSLLALFLVVWLVGDPLQVFLKKENRVNQNSECAGWTAADVDADSL